MVASGLIPLTVCGPAPGPESEHPPSTASIAAEMPPAVTLRRDNPRQEAESSGFFTNESSLAEPLEATCSRIAAHRAIAASFRLPSAQHLTITRGDLSAICIFGKTVGVWHVTDACHRLPLDHVHVTVMTSVSENRVLSSGETIPLASSTVGLPYLQRSNRFRRAKTGNHEGS